MKRSFFVHFAMMTVVCAVGARPAVAQNAAEEIATQTLAATADVAPRIEKPGVFKRTFSWMGDRMSDGSGRAKDGLYAELGGMIPGAGISVGPGYRHHVFGEA